MTDLLQNLNRVRYSGADYHTISDEILARIQVKFAEDFNDFAASQLGIMLIDLVSFGLDTLSFYLDRRATDTYLQTARTRRSVARLTRQLGYKMRSAIASSVTISMRIIDVFVIPVPIAAGFQFKGPNGLIFEAAQLVTFNPGDGAKEIPLYEGQTFSETFVSDGLPNQVFELRRVRDGRYAVGGSVRVTVNGTAWTESEFLTFDQTNQFEIGYNDDPPTLRFGDGVAGNTPVLGASIVIRYVVSRGRLGLVGRNAITGPVVPITSNFQTLRVSVSNGEGSIGGDDPETIEEAKRNAPRVFKTRQVAVTREDYESLGNAYADPLAGRVAVAQAISSRSAEQDLYLRNQLAAIEDQFVQMPTDVEGYLTSAEAKLDTIRTELATLLTALTSTASQTSGADTDLAGGLVNGRAVKNKAQDFATDANDVNTNAATIVGTVTGISTGGSDQLLVATKNLLLDSANRIVALASGLVSAAGILIADQNSETTAINNAKTKLSTVGLNLSSGLLGTMATARTSVSTNVGVPEQVAPLTPVTATGIYADLKNIDILIISGSVDTDPEIPSGTDRLSIVSACLDNIYDHVDRLLAADCKSNLVTVPILARDVGGFYAAPSVALIQSLQLYLDARKEVTQTVEVVSGSRFLIQPKITIRLAVSPGYSLAITQAAVSAAVDGVLRNRRFGQSLYVSELNDAITALVGVGFTNVIIQGYKQSTPLGDVISASKNDAEGNLIIQTAEIITKDTADSTMISIATEAFSTGS